MTKHKLTGQGGKESQRRNSNEKAYADNWEKIFGKHKKDIAQYEQTLRERGIEPPHKKHYGDTDGNKV